LLAESTRNFAGVFHVTDVVDNGSIVKFNLEVHVQNVTATDVSAATLTLQSSKPGAPVEDPDFTGSFANVKIPAHKTVTLSGVFTVPSSEYEQWQRGGGPKLVVTYLNESQEEVQSTAELRPHH
jgi:hypothetical protein